MIKDDQGWRGRLIYLIVLLALVPRLYHLRQPLLDNHSWRQTHTAMQSYLFWRERNPITRPKTVWGREGRSDLPEFPLYTFAVSLLYRAFGPEEMWGRLASIAFCLAAILFFYKLTRKCFSLEIALLAAFFFSFSPLLIFYSRCFIRNGGSAIFFPVAALYFATELIERKNAAAFWLAALAGSCAVLDNIASGYVFLPAVAYALAKEGRRALREWRLWVLVGLAAACGSGWIWYLASVVRGGGIPGGIRGGRAGFRDWGAFSYWIQWCDPRFFRTIFVEMRDYALSWAGIVFAAVGLASLIRDRRPGARLFLAWLAAALAYAAADSYPFFIVLHEYYYLIFLPPAAFLCAFGFSRILSLLRGFRGAFVARASLMAAASILFFVPAWRRTLAHFYPLNRRLYEFALELRRRLPEEELLYTEAWGPEALYYSRHYGWWAARLSSSAESGRRAVASIRRMRERERLRYVAFIDFGAPRDGLIARFLGSHELLWRAGPDERGRRFYLYRLE